MAGSYRSIQSLASLGEVLPNYQVPKTHLPIVISSIQLFIGVSCSYVCMNVTDVHMWTWVPTHVCTSAVARRAHQMSCSVTPCPSQVEPEAQFGGQSASVILHVP